MTPFHPFPHRPDARAQDPTSEEALAGEATGYVLGAPLRVLRFDQLRVYNSRLRGRTGGARSIFGVGGLLGAAALPLAAEADCTKGELLAINDVEWYRDRLVKYYGRLGFEAVKEVEVRRRASARGALMGTGDC